MHYKIFYSWQSDLPNNTNRYFISSAIECAIEEFKKKDEYKIEPVLDRDTIGVSGSPDISQTIFEKINNCDLFVADVSIIGKNGQKFFPNSNVLIEVGYAIKSLGWKKVVLIFNLSFGKPEDLPFDLRSKRITSYNCSESEEQKSEKKKELAKILTEAIVLGVKDTRHDSSLTSDPLVKERDILLFKEFQSVLPSSGSIAFLKGFDMAGAFRDDELNDIRNFHVNWGDLEHEFIDETAEKLRSELFDAIDKYYQVIAIETFGTEVSNVRSVPKEWKWKQPERFRRVVLSLIELAQKVIEKHQSLMKYGIQKFSK